MHSKSVWKLARRPNYTANVDKLYPYSEIPYVGQYDLVKIPINGELIELVDYWGEGRIISEGKASGFEDSYCVNHEYQLVSNGPDRDRKIPNRIPVISYVNCDTSAYIKDDSVKTVTLMGAPINKSCASDIARIVNKTYGKVIVYGFDETAADIRNLETALLKKDIIFCFEFNTEELYLQPTIFESHRVYANTDAIKQEMKSSVVNKNYKKVLGITNTLQSNYGSVVVDVVNDLIKNCESSITGYAHQLWINNYKNVIENYFPLPFKTILNSEPVKLMNLKSSEYLKLDSYMEWKLIPSWEDNDVCFRIMNIGSEMFLGLDADIDEHGVRKVWCYKTTMEEPKLKWTLQPKKKGDVTVFVITSKSYGVRLKFDEGTNTAIDTRPVVDSYKDIKENDSYHWVIMPATSTS